MPEGVLIRELPDGGHEFVLDDPTLIRVALDERVTLRFGQTDVTVSGPFDFEVDGVDHHVDTRAPESLAPLLSAYPGTARWLWASPIGALTLEFMQGQKLVVPAPMARSGWTVGGARGPGT